MSFEGISVGLVGPVPPPAGGMANQTRQLAELLGAAGAQVLRVATNAPYRPQWVGRWRGLRALVRLVLYVGALWRVCGRCQLLHVMANSGWSWHLCALPALLVGRLRHVPVVINYRGGAAAEFLAKSGVSVRAAMRLASHLVVPSGFLVDVFARHGMHAAVVPNIIDVACFTRRGPRAAGSAHLVVARHLEALYDNATAIRALVLLRQRLPCARLTLAGVGPQAAALHALAVELGVVDAVHFAGHLDRQDMAALYRQADLSLNPSLADNMPNSVLESMASGVPVISTRVGGVPYIIRDGDTGALVPPGDPAAMAEASWQLLTVAEDWQRIADNAHHEVQRYAWPQVAQRWSAVYRDALASRAAPRTTRSSP